MTAPAFFTRHSSPQTVQAIRLDDVTALHAASLWLVDHGVTTRVDSERCRLTVLGPGTVMRAELGQWLVLDCESGELTAEDDAPGKFDARPAAPTLTVVKEPGQ